MSPAREMDPQLAEREERIARRIEARAAADIVAGLCPVHHTPLTPLGLGRSPIGSCEACSGAFWTYSTHSGVRSEPMSHLNWLLFAAYIHVEVGPVHETRIQVSIGLVGRVIEIADEIAGMLDASAEAEHYAVDGCQKILSIAVGIALGVKFVHGL